MGSCGKLASANEPIVCGPGVTGQETVSEQLTCKGASQTSPDCNASYDRASTFRETEQFGIEGGCSPSNRDKTGFPVPEKDGQCAENGVSECESQSETGFSNLGREDFQGEVGVGNLEKGDELIVSELTSLIDCLDNPSGVMEGEDQIGGDGSLLNWINLSEEAAQDLVVMEASTGESHSLIIDECLDKRKEECRMISEEFVLTPDNVVENGQMESCHLETLADSMDEKVDDIAEAEPDTGERTPCLKTSEMPTENAFSSANPGEIFERDGDKSVSGFSFDTGKGAVEEVVVAHMDKPEFPSNDTGTMEDNSCPVDPSCHAVLKKALGDDRNVTCLSSEEASVDAMRDINSVGNVEAEMCITTPSIQVTKFLMEDDNIEVPLQNHEQTSNEVDSMTESFLVSEVDVGVRFEAHPWNETSSSQQHVMPCEKSCAPDCLIDCDLLKEQRSVAQPSVLPSDEFPGVENVKIQDTDAQFLHSNNDQGISEVLDTSPLLGHTARVHAREDGNGAPAGTTGELVEEGSPLRLDEVIENDGRVLYLEENACNAESSSGGLLSLQPREPTITVKNCSSKSANDEQNMIVTVATTSSVINDYLGEKDAGRKPDGRSECVPETESPVVLTSSSRRSSRANKSGRKTQAKRASRYSRSASKVPYHAALELIFKGAKKKRTCCSKTPRSSTWGVMQNVSQHFGHMDVHGSEPAQSQGSRKPRIGQESRKQSKNQSGGSSQVSKGNIGASSNRIRLKVKMGKEVVMISEVVHPAASLGAFASASRANNIANVASLTNGCKEKNQLDSLDATLNKRNSHLSDPLVEEDPNLIIKDSAHDGRDYCDPVAAKVGSEGGTVEDRYLTFETSPDSEVINLMPETHVSERQHESACEVAMYSSKSHVVCEDVQDLRKGKKKDKVSRQSSSRRKDKSGSSSSKRRGNGVKAGEGFSSVENFATLASANRLSNLSSNTESLPLSNEADLAFLKGPLNIEIGAKTFHDQDISIESTDLEYLKNDVLSSDKRKVQKKVKSSKSGKVSDGRSEELNSSKSRKGASCKQKKNAEKSSSKSTVQERDPYNQFLCKTEGHALDGDGGRNADWNSNNEDYLWTSDTSKLEIKSDRLLEKHSPQNNAWVCCDDCHKWRRIAAALADSIEDSNSNWTCKDNLDKSFADCSIPQEMSNSDINAELDISDYSCEEEDSDGNQYYKELRCSRPTVSQQSSFIQIDSNKFLHRSRKTQTIDEIMVCLCKPPLDGKLGCGNECLNRVLNIECVQGTCPCGDLCSNQQFQKHNYAKLQWFRCGKKGYGLQVQEDVSEGDFIIEYVGEVLGMSAYEERQRDYAARGHKHFYFMTLNGSEVIDACVKGNLGRFINHSCDPNCRTEKWVVNGEICIGLFALRDIKKGEEVTFDYNYVRVFGAAAKKCVCGSPLCRGYIGGDLQSSETIVQGDSDDEFPEPVMLNENGDVAYKFDDAVSRGSDIPVTYLPLKDKNELMKELDNTLENNHSAHRSAFDKGQSGRSLEKALASKAHQGLSVSSKDVRRTPSPDSQQKIPVKEVVSNLNHMSTTEMTESPGRAGSLTELRSLVKTPRPSITVKKVKVSTKSQNANKSQATPNKPQVVPVKPKKQMEGSSNGRFEAVQEKLNELLDADGGISKRKDAPKGYLRLLLLTAASGDSGNGEAIQSNRDLSMILDALLKTRSRVVLMDIINKNGLRMLHNIMKQYRRDFKKIPILRKLLKVLEYLALREILTLEHINVGAPCPGMESFRESILSFTEHDDKQVHQIARNFRDRWIPRYLRKVGYADRDDGMNPLVRGLNSNNFLSPQSNWRDVDLSRPVESTDQPHQPSRSATASSTTDNSSNDGGSTSGTGVHKRKSRWDSDTNPYLESLKRRETSLNGDKTGQDSNCELEAPPGFSSPLDVSRVPAKDTSASAAAVDQSADKVQYLRCPFDAVIGQPQERFKSQLPVSYGVPLLILQQFGTPQAGSMESWAIAPGMPFHPFPPLPPFPRDRKRQSPSSLDCGTNSCNSIHSSADEKQHDSVDPSTNGSNLTDADVPCTEDQHSMMPLKRLKGSSSQDLGRRYFRQQKWNSTKMPPPWVRSCWRSNPRGGPGPVPNEQRSSENAIECTLGKDEGSYQDMPPTQNHLH